MDSGDILEGRRPLNDNDLASIAKAVSRPKEVDEVMFTQVLTITMRKYKNEIVGVETDPLTKEYLKQKELHEEERLARLQVKLTRELRDASNFPSARDEALPKYYRVEEIPKLISDWTKKIENEVMSAFSLEYIYFSDAELKQITEAVNSKRDTPLEPKNLDRIRDELAKLTYDKANFQALLELMADLYAGSRIPKWSFVLDSIKELKTGERPLTPSQIEEILSVIDYSKYYKGDHHNIVINSEVNNAAVEKVKLSLRQQLMRAKIKPSRVPRLREMIQQRFERALALPGKMVGNIMASSFGEAATQQTLNTFHSAGDRNARKNITGFAKLDGILRAVENPQISNMTVFPKRRLTGEQMESRIPSFQMTTLADLIETHKVIPFTDPMPRWEYVSDVVSGISYSAHYDERFNRLNLHRMNPRWGVTGRILQIKLNVREIFFRGISMSQIAKAIEESSSEYRVVASPMDLGLLHVFFNFNSVSSIPGITEQAPAFALHDEFEFTLENIIYPRIVEIQVSGIYGIDYVSIQNYRISNAINIGKSEMEMEEGINRVKLQFVKERCILWGIHPYMIYEFVMTKLRPLMPFGYDVHPVFDSDNYTFSFDSAGLRMYDYKTDVYQEVQLSDITTLINVDTKPRIFNLLRRVILPAEEVQFYRTKSSVRHKEMAGNPEPNGIGVFFQDVTSQNQGGANLMPKAIDPNRDLVKNPKRSRAVQDVLAEFNKLYVNRPVRLLPGSSNVAVIEFDNEILEDLQIDLNSIVSVLSSTPELSAQTISVSDVESQILISDIDRLDTEGREVTAFIEDLLKTIDITSDYIDQSVLRWYYNIEGKGYATVMSNPDVDTEYSRTDNIIEIFRTLGTEACRSVLLDEIASSTDSKINPVHVELMADSMLYKTPGDKPLSQDRFGLAKRGAEFIGRMVETTNDVLMQAGLGYVDNLNSFPSQIMLGLLKKTGLLTAEDREEILKDPAFRYDFPQPEVKDEPIAPALQIQAEYVKEEKEEGPKLRVGRARKTEVEKSKPKQATAPSKRGGKLE